jgi:hypothetical protein
MFSNPSPPSTFNRQRSTLKETVMTTIRRIFRPATRLAAAAVALLGGMIAGPAAFASPAPPPGIGDTGTSTTPAVVHTVTVGGTPGWQIALFIVAAAAVAAVIAVLLDRTRSARRQQLAPSAP